MAGPEGRLRILAGGDFLVRPAGPDRPAGRVAADDPAAAQDPDPAARAVTGPVLDPVVGGPAGEVDLERGEDPGPVVRVDALLPEPVIAGHILDGVAEHPGPAVIVPDGPGGDVPVPDPQVAPGQGQIQSVLARARPPRLGSAAGCR